MKVGQRLFLAVLPAILGLFLVAALAYWGQYAREAPELVVLLATGATLVSLVVSWRNTRYVADRIARLAGRVPRGSAGTPGAAAAARGAALRELGFRDIADAVTGGKALHGGADELDEIEATVAGLSSAVVEAREAGSRRERAAEARAHEYEALLDAVTARLGQRIQEVQLPLHILLSSPFGTLNENQEEMLGAAQGAVDIADTEVRQLRKLIELDRGALSVVPQPIGLAELLRPALAIGRARAEAARVQFTASVADAVPRVLADAARAQEAITSVLADAIGRTPAGGDVTLDAEETDAARVRVIVTRRSTDPTRQAGPQDPAPSLEMRLARRLLEAQHASFVDGADATVIELPIETLARVSQ